MSLIHTCELADANPFDYLNELQRHASELAANPSAWMPWNLTNSARPKSLVSGHPPLHCGNAHKTCFSARAIAQGFWPPPASRLVRSRFHARSTDTAVADPSHARIRSQARLDHRRADQRGRLRRFPTRVARNADGCCTKARNRCGSGVALRSLGPLRRGPGFDATGTSASRGGFGFLDRSTRSAHTRAGFHGALNSSPAPRGTSSCRREFPYVGDRGAPCSSSPA